MLALPIFPGRRQPSIVGRDELNYRVRNGNGWTLILINTNYIVTGPPQQQTHYTAPCSRCQGKISPQHQGNERSSLSGDPYRIRTDVNGVRGRCLNHLTNGPRRRKKLRSTRSRLQAAPSGESSRRSVLPPFPPRPLRWVASECKQRGSALRFLGCARRHTRVPLVHLHGLEPGTH